MPDEIDLHFPAAGVSVEYAFGKQPNQPAAHGKYARTTPLGRNVRTFDSLGRARGGMRPGLVKYISVRPGDVRFITQALGKITVMGETPVQPSQLGRDNRLYAVSQGNFYYVSSGGSTWIPAVNGTIETPPLNITGLVAHAVNNQLVFFADGTNWVYYDPVDNTLKPWVMTAGERPVDADDNTPRLICTWRGRTVLSGIIGDSCNWFMSAVSDPFDFNYAPPQPVPETAAVAGNIAPQGFVGQSVTALIPYTDDVLIMGMTSNIALFRGDPNAGGQIDIVTKSIGILQGESWAMDSDGTVYFFSNLTGVFRFVPGSQPERMSHPIDNLLSELDTGEYNVMLAWDDTRDELHVFVTLLTTTLATTHYCWEKKSNAWWTVVFSNADHNPLCRVSFDGNMSSDRKLLIGSWDGYVRSVSSDATDDDGTDIESECWIGPFLTNIGDSVLLREVQAIMGETSGDVNFAIYVGETSEEALSSTAVATGTWQSGRNYTDIVMRAGHSAFIQITSGVAWAMESIRVIVGSQGTVRRRGK
jgi:hypothetical protein